MNSVNKFRTPINRKNTNDSDSISNLMFKLNQRFISKQEADEKYLDKSEGDKLYINEPITENINMKNRKITSSSVPTNPDDLTNKKYVDSLIVDKIGNNRYFLKDTELERMLIYYNLVLTFKPKVWI